MEMYQRLVEYKQKHRSTSVPRSFKDDRRLANWVQTQRLYCKDQHRIDLLNYIGFEWNPYEDTWMHMYRRLLEYKQKYKSTRVHCISKADPKLATWIYSQRKTCKEKDRVDLLNDIGFEWDPIGDDWKEMYQRLLEYQKKTNSTLVPYKFKADPKLGRWVYDQRRQCKRKDRVALLNDIGFVWSWYDKRSGH
jgi:hypothetical protein